MPTTDSDTPGPPTISVSTMSAISIDLDRRAALWPRQAGPGARAVPSARVVPADPSHN